MFLPISTIVINEMPETVGLICCLNLACGSIEIPNCVFVVLCLLFSLLLQCLGPIQTCRKHKVRMPWMTNPLRQPKTMHVKREAHTHTHTQHLLRL